MGRWVGGWEYGFLIGQEDSWLNGWRSGLVNGWVGIWIVDGWIGG